MAQDDPVTRSDDESSHIGGDKGGWPVMAVLGVAIMLPVLSGVGGVMGMLSVSCEEELQSTRDVGGRGVEECFTASSEWLELEAENMLRLFAAAVDRIVLNYFDITKVKMNHTTELLFSDAAPLTFPKLKSHRKELYQTLKGSFPVGVRAIYAHTPDHYSMGYHKFGVFNVQSYTTTDTNIGQMHTGDVDTNGEYITSTMGMVNLQLSATPVFNQVIQNDFWDGIPYKWSSLRIINEFVGFTLLMKHSTGAVVGVSMTLAYLESSFRLLIEAEAEHGAENGRLYTCVASSWLADAKRAQGDPDAENFDTTHALTGVSHGSSYVSLSSSRVGLRMDVDSDDVIIRSIAVHINGTYAELKNTAFRVMTPNGTQLVSVTSLEDGAGIAWWVVSSIDMEFVTGKVLEKRDAIYAQIVKEKRDVDDNVAEHQLNSILIAAGICIVMLGTLLAVVLWILQPVKVMQNEMARVAEMQLDNTHSIKTTSTVREVRRMQRDFLKMLTSLREYRAYVPASVLAGEVAVEPPKGEITVVFTDIENSTSLWRDNPAAMNTAMESHNEIIREAYKEYRGYEVKTIGDAFMLAFSTPDDAVLTCVEVLEKFAFHKWPVELPLPSGVLRVRMGMHTGPAIAEHNPLTSRIDYRGSTVNLASRVEGKAPGAALCITEHVRERILDKASGNFKITPYGTHELKGLGGGHKLFVVHPLGLAAEGGGYSVVDGWETSSSVGSGTVDRVEGKMVATGVKKTGLSLVSGSATVAVCRMTHFEGNRQFDNANLMVRAAADVAIATDGAVGSVTGNTMTVFWNCSGSKTVTLHLTHALRFAADLERRVGRKVLHVGVGTGPVQHGNIGTSKTRFSGVFGLPMEIASVSAQVAHRLESFCIVCDCTTIGILKADPTLSSFMRLVDKWQLTLPYARYVTFYDLLEEQLREVLNAWDSPTPPSDTAEDHLVKYAEVVSAIFRDEDTTSSMAALHTLAVSYPEDKVLMHVHEILEARGDAVVPSTGLYTLP